MTIHLELEEGFGRAWHRFITRRASPTFEDAAVSLDEVRRSLLLHGQGGPVLDEVVFADEESQDMAVAGDESPALGLRERLAEQERKLIEEALRRARGNLSQAAASLRIPRTTLLGRLQRLAIRHPPAGDTPA